MNVRANSLWYRLNDPTIRRRLDKVRLAGRPVPRVSLSMEAGDHDDSVWLLDEKQPVRKAVNPGPSPVLLDHGEVQRVGCNSHDRFIHCVGKRVPSSGRISAYQDTASL